MQKTYKRTMSLLLALALIIGISGQSKSEVYAADSIDSGRVVGSSNAPYLDLQLGSSRQRILNELNKNKSLYNQTKFSISKSPYFTRENTMRIGYRFNCTGFVAIAFERAGADLSLLNKSYNSWMAYSNLNKWTRYIVHGKNAKSYRYTSVSALLNSGRAQKGDLIIMQPMDWSVGYKDAHVGFFWGDTPYENKFWHQTRAWGNSVTNIKGFVTNPVYYLVPLSPSNLPGTIEIRSKDATTKSSLSGVNYQLLDKNKRLVNLSLSGSFRYSVNKNGNRTSAWTDYSGFTRITNVTPGQYYLRQINKRDGYIQGTSDHPIYVSDGQTKIAELFHRHEAGNIKIVATDSLTDQAMGVNYQLLDSDKKELDLNLAGSFRYTYKPNGNRSSAWTDRNGVTEISNLPTGQYYLRQLNNIAGYKKRTSDQAVWVNKDKTSIVNIKHYHDSGNIKIVATDGLTDQAMGVNYQLLDRDKKELDLNLAGSFRYTYKPNGNRASVWTDTNGVTEIANLPPGQYYLRQLNTINGYRKEADDISVWVDKDGTTVKQIKHYPDSGGLKIIAKDSISGQGMGVSYELLDSNKERVDLNLAGSFRYTYLPGGNRASAWTDRNGVTEITNLPPGQYYLRQFNTIDGYRKETNDILVRINMGEKNIVEIAYTQNAGSIKVIARDAQSGQGIGLNYELLDTNKEIVELNLSGSFRYSYKPGGNRTSAWTDTSGITEISNLPPGKYYLHQVNTIAGYDMQTSIWPVLVNLGQQSEIVIPYSELIE